MCATWRFSGNEVLEAELCFGPAVTQWTRLGQCTWGLTEQKWVSMKGATGKGGNCVKATPLFLSAHLLIFLHTPLIPRQSFWVMSCCGRPVGTPSCRDGIRESLAWVTAGRTCQGKPSGGGSGVSIMLISREERTSAVRNNLNVNLNFKTHLKTSLWKSVCVAQVLCSFKPDYVRTITLTYFHIYEMHFKNNCIELYLHIGSILTFCTQHFLMCLWDFKKTLAIKI